MLVLLNAFMDYRVKHQKDTVIEWSNTLIQ